MFGETGLGATRRREERAFPRAIADMLAGKPETAFYNFTADIAERLIPGFHASNFYDVILAAPFKE
ncbi:hypothetical protein BE21_11620 [Sorangium cellulosum]|uniref:Uncharacterized protein n=1 Tax=Sorangium cellulosum TaxID=56 RepID=A0A150U0K8_SORCE|nr:hypothetical protein BE21_11620 [Sorangium cellulosum]